VTSGEYAVLKGEPAAFFAVIEGVFEVTKLRLSRESLIEPYRKI
jgi:hypothetical protein